MRRIPVLALVVVLAAVTAGCISKQEAHSGAIRFLNAVPDAPRMSLYVDNELQAAGFDYSSSSSWSAIRADTYPVRIDELLPIDAVPNTYPAFNGTVDLAVNDQLTLIVVGQAAGHAEETIQIRTRTSGVPTGKTRVQFANATGAVGAVDVYVTLPDAVITASTPLAPALAYKAYTTQQDIDGGSAKIVVTAAGDPTTVLLDSGQIFLPLEGNLLITLVQNTGLDFATRPVSLVIMLPTGSSTIIDKNAKGNVRVVNASPGSYSLDAFINKTTVDNTARQVCDAGTTEADTLLEFCALPYEYVGPYAVLDPATYDFKVQKTDAPAVLAKTFGGNVGPGGQSTLIMTGLLADSATSTEVGLITSPGIRRIATSAQLRLVDVSIAGNAAISGDPTTDRLEIYITDPGVDLTPLDPNFSGFGFGADTGYFYEIPGTYQVTVAKSDTATPTVPPVVLVSEVMTLDGSGIYTLLIADSVGGVQPLRYLSIDDDPTP